MMAEAKVIKKERIAWIDNMKFFAIMCVVFYHSSALVVEEKYYVGWVIESFNMSMFFFLSGLSSYSSISRVDSFVGLMDYTKKKFLRIMLPCLFVSMLVFQKPCSFWFLLTLFYYLTTFALFRFVCKLAKISSSYAFFMFMTLLLVNVPKIGNDQEFIISFALGLLCAKVNIIERIKETPKKFLILVMIAGFVFWLALLPYYQSFYLNQLNSLWHNHTLYIFFIRQIIELSFVVACCLLFMNYMDTKTKLTVWGGGGTLGIYIVHVTILTILDNHHIFINARNQLWGNFFEIAGFLVLTAITMFLVNILSKWKWTRILVLGQK